MSRHLLNNEYYYENSAGVLLSEKGRSVIDAEMEKHVPTCVRCGEKLVLITMMEGDFIICPVDMYNHANNWNVVYDKKHVAPPYIENG